VSKREDSFDGGLCGSNAPESDVVVIFNHQFFVMGILPTGNFLIYHLRMGTRLLVHQKSEIPSATLLKSANPDSDVTFSISHTPHDL